MRQGIWLASIDSVLVGFLGTKLSCSEQEWLAVRTLVSSSDRNQNYSARSWLFVVWSNTHVEWTEGARRGGENVFPTHYNDMQARNIFPTLWCLRVLTPRTPVPLRSVPTLPYPDFRPINESWLVLSLVDQKPNTEKVGFSKKKWCKKTKVVPNNFSFSQHDIYSLLLCDIGHHLLFPLAIL